MVQVGIKSRFVGYDDSTACSVESLVLQHLSQQDAGSWAGWHCEGSPVRGLWALLMWDIIFADVPDVFQVHTCVVSTRGTVVGRENLCLCACVCVIKLHITTQSGPFILVTLYHSH